MSLDFCIHTINSAPESSVETLKKVDKTFGFIPNLFGVMAEAPNVIKAYLELYQLYNYTSLTPTERQVVSMTVNHFHHCHYCMAAHSTIAEKQKIERDIVESLRNNQPIVNKKLEALRKFTLLVVKKRGQLNSEDIERIKAYKYSEQQILEVVLGVSFKILSNYVNHIVNTPLDREFTQHKWTEKIKLTN